MWQFMQVIPYMQQTCSNSEQTILEPCKYAPDGPHEPRSGPTAGIRDERMLPLAGMLPILWFVRELALGGDGAAR